VTSRDGSGFLGGAGASGSDTTTWSRTPASIQITSADIVGYTINVTLTGGATNTLTATLNGITNGAINPFAVMLTQESQGPGSYTYHFGLCRKTGSWWSVKLQGLIA
jgi:hypothetical protein